MGKAIEGVFFFEQRRASLLGRFGAGMRLQLSHLSLEDLEDDLSVLRCKPEATRPLSWDSEMSVLVHSAINGIENTLRARQAGSSKKLPFQSSLAGMARMMTVLQPRKVDTHARKPQKRSVSFPSCASSTLSSVGTSCKATDTVSIGASQTRCRNVLRARRTIDPGLLHTTRIA